MCFYAKTESKESHFRAGLKQENVDTGAPEEWDRSEEKVDPAATPKQNWSKKGATSEQNRSKERLVLEQLGRKKRALFY